MVKKLTLPLRAKDKIGGVLAVSVLYYTQGSAYYTMSEKKENMQTLEE